MRALLTSILLVSISLELSAQQGVDAARDRISFAEPVGITAINARTGVITARDAQNRRTIEFRVADTVLQPTLKVGQTVYLDSEMQQVSVDSAEPEHNIAVVRVQPDR